MNKILIEIKKIINENIEKYLPDILLNELEDNGSIFYMNGKNGTEFDWYVNERLSEFMVFYNDENNMGAIKTTLYNNGEVITYVYGEHGNKFIEEIKSKINISDEEIFTLAVVLKNEADNKRIWDANIENINSEINYSEIDIWTEEFNNNSKFYDDMRERKRMIGLGACVSKKILEEGYKVGYMSRYEASFEYDSGWTFMAGNEDAEYVNNADNYKIISVNSVAQLDRAIWKHIINPIGTKLIRVSPEDFEIDDDSKEIYIHK